MEFRFTRGASIRLASTSGTSTVLGKTWKRLPPALHDKAKNTPGVDFRDGKPATRAKTTPAKPTKLTEGAIV